MSVRWLSSVWSDPDIQNRSELLVMLAIADYCNEDGKAWPSIDNLASKSRTTTRQVQYVIAALCKRSKLSVDLCAGPHKTNIYSILSGGVQPLHPEIQRCKSQRKSQRAVAPDPSLPVRNRQDPPKEAPAFILKEFPRHLNTARIQNKWQVWMTVRRGMRSKPQNWLTLFNEQIEWLAQFTEPDAFESLSASIRGNWQGLFPPKPQASGNGSHSYNNGKPPARDWGDTELRKLGVKI